MLYMIAKLIRATYLINRATYLYAPTTSRNTHGSTLATPIFASASSPIIMLFRRALTNVLFLFGCACLSAQTVNFDQVVLPLETRPRNFEDLLVQLAWNNSPENRILELEKQITEKEARLSRLKWTESIQGGFNLNEVSLGNVINPSQDNFVAFPLYTFNAAVSLNTLLTQGDRKEIGRLKILQSDSDINQAKLGVRRAVLNAYAEYLASVEALKSRTNATDDLRAAYELSAQLFKEDKINFEEFSNVSSGYFTSNE